MPSESPLVARTCFLVSPADAELSGLKEYFRKRQVEWRSAELVRDGSGIQFALRSVMRESDFVCVVLPKVPTPNLMFELGLAVGLGKPTVVIAPSEEDFPSDLRTATFIRAEGWNSAVLEPHLEAFLRTLPSKTRGRSEKRRVSRKLRNFTSEREQIQNAKTELSPRQLEEFVANLFRKAGFDVTSAPLSDFGADMAVWSPAIREQFGNPILVEVKHGRLTRATALWGVENLAKLVNAGRGSAAVYVTLQPVDGADEMSRFESPTSAPVLFMTVSELLSALEANEFTDKVKAARNLVFGRKS